MSTRIQAQSRLACQSTPNLLRTNLGRISPSKQKKLYKMLKISREVLGAKNSCGIFLKMLRNSVCAAHLLNILPKIATTFKAEVESLLPNTSLQHTGATITTYPVHVVATITSPTITITTTDEAILTIEPTLTHAHAREAVTTIIITIKNLTPMLLPHLQIPP